MKKYIILLAAGCTVLFLSNCSSSKKAAAPAKLKITYETAIATTVMNNCSPCHIPSKGGNKRAYDNYDNVKSDIDEIIRRIELTPGQRGFMPFKGNKLSDSTIALFREWKENGLPQ